jgi:hypothetical protein
MLRQRRRPPGKGFSTSRHQVALVRGSIVASSWKCCQYGRLVWESKYFSGYFVTSFAKSLFRPFFPAFFWGVAMLLQMKLLLFGPEDVKRRGVKSIQSLQKKPISCHPDFIARYRATQSLSGTG